MGWLFGCTLVIFLMSTGCAGTRPGDAANNISNLLKLRKDGFVHTVQWKGETLSVIAKWYTGRADNWRALANANAKFNPTLLKKGYRIFIPRHLLKRTDPMPVDFTNTSTERQTQTLPSPDEAASLFGPKQ